MKLMPPDVPSRRLLRSDLVALACFVVVAACLITGRWQGLALGALVGGQFAGLSPRLRGDFAIRWLGGEARGRFRDPD
jgi:hypothetical protein